MLHLIAGLGNPGPRFDLTRHNAGFLVIDELADRAGAALRSQRTGKGAPSEFAECRLGGPVGSPANRRVVLLKPMSFMNVSGGPVSGIANFFKVPAEHIIAIHDELDLPFGEVRIKQGGGEGGHNGLRSMSQSLGTKNYIRIRVGIGRPPGRQSGADYVLSPFSATERKELPSVIGLAADAVEALLPYDDVTEAVAAAQNTFHAL